jgi:transposase
MEENKKLLEVEKCLKQEQSRRMFERFQTVRLYLLGYTQQQIATIIARSEKTVNTYLQCYEASGLEGLQIKFAPGRRERLTKEQQVELKQAIMGFLPHEVGFTAKFNWTLELICEYIKREYGANYSIRGASKLMHRLGMSYTKPTYTLAAADKEKQSEFVETTFPALKKLRERRN